MVKIKAKKTRLIKLKILVEIKTCSWVGQENHQTKFFK